jgi:adenine-specific DNA-methyltransferase
MVSICRELFPNINTQVCNFLEMDHKPEYDFVIGNPPYFEMKKDTISDKVKQKFSSLFAGRVNIYAMFIKASIDCLVEGGQMVFVIPKSINNGYYFRKFRKYIIDTCNITEMRFYDRDMFEDAEQEVMILCLQRLRAGERNNGDFTFQKSGMDYPIFSLYKSSLEKMFTDSTTLKDLGFEVKTGNFVWNQNKRILSRCNQDTKLIWAANIKANKIVLDIESLNQFGIEKKPKYQKAQYVRDNDKISKLKGKCLVINRVVGTSRGSSLRVALINYGEEGYYVENHLNVITATKHSKCSLEDLREALIQPSVVETLKMITGSTQLSTKELVNLIPIQTKE